METLAIERLRTKALEVGAPIGDLAAVCIMFALKHIDTQHLVQWASNLTPTRGRLAGAMTKSERAVLAALETLKEAQKPAWRFELNEIADTAGLLRKDAYLALNAVRARGLVKNMDGEELDRWKRPVSSIWWKTEVKP
jgi:hypothetical protein